MSHHCLVRGSLLATTSKAGKPIVPSLLIRNVEKTLHTRLKQRAAAHHRSLEAEARELLRLALARQPQENIMDIARRLFRPKHGFDLPIPSRRREPERPPPDFSGPEYDP
jgi:plasmid stability protein